MSTSTPDNDARDPLVGRTYAGRYLIRCLLARRSMGRVYEAEQQPLGRSVALKVLDVTSSAINPASADRYRERFLREASLLARLSHPNTVRVFDYGVEGTDSFLVMELVKGRTLRSMVEGGRLDPLRVVRIGRQICASLSEGHEHGLVHRDLKPANVLVSSTPEGGDLVKVVDFGLVKEVEDAVHMTGEGWMVGTPMYMAPEQIRGRKLDQRCDIYALGVLLYHAVTGTFPFEQGQPSSVLMAHLNDPPIALRETAPDLALPEWFVWTVERCLEKDRDDRFLNMRELERALKLCEAALLDEASTSMARLALDQGRLVLPEAIYGPTPPPTPARQASRWVTRLVVGAAVMVGCMLLATIVGFALVQGVTEVAGAERPAVPTIAPATVRELAEAPSAPTPEPARDAEVTVAAAPEPAAAPLPAPKRQVRRTAPSPQPPAQPPAPAAPPLDPRSSDLKDPWSHPSPP